MYCPECGDQIQEEAKFCPECGHGMQEGGSGVKDVSKWFAALSNLLITGLGYYYITRQTDEDYSGKGRKFLIYWGLGLLTTPVGIGFAILAIIMAYSIYDCFSIAEELS